MDSLLETFDREMRRVVRTDRPAVREQADAHVIRTVGDGDHGWCGVGWSSLDETSR